jgi:hypothetical protein
VEIGRRQQEINPWQITAYLFNFLSRRIAPA